jgi:hypothetical protein
MYFFLCHFKNHGVTTFSIMTLRVMTLNIPGTDVGRQYHSKLPQDARCFSLILVIRLAVERSILLCSMERRAFKNVNNGTAEERDN